ncbi:MAG: hypothetical protein O2931_10455, partial [Planctomycetota bacterium]|nr:hypothetical protein [Planctomycetota bacterium]
MWRNSSWDLATSVFFWASVLGEQPTKVEYHNRKNRSYNPWNSALCRFSIVTRIDSRVKQSIDMRLGVRLFKIESVFAIGPAAKAGSAKKEVIYEIDSTPFYLP